MQPFGEAVAKIAAARPDVEILLPAVPHLGEEIAVRVGAWPRQPDDSSSAKRKNSPPSDARTRRSPPPAR